MGGLHMALRQLFVLVAFIAVCCAALKFAGIWASILFAVALLWVVGMTIVAFVDRGARQAYAIGFTLAALIYAATVLATHAASGGVELDPYSGSLPTTKLLRPVYTLIVQQTWIDMATGKEVPNYDPSKGASGGGMGGGVGLSEFPLRRAFMTVGHIIWTTLFGCVGGLFGRLTYARREKNGSPP
jgi:hypothetical protein